MNQQLEIGSYYLARNKTIWHITAKMEAIYPIEKVDYPLGFCYGYQITMFGMTRTSKVFQLFGKFGKHDEYPEHQWDLMEEVFL